MVNYSEEEIHTLTENNDYIILPASKQVIRTEKIFLPALRRRIVRLSINTRHGQIFAVAASHAALLWQRGQARVKRSVFFIRF